MRILLPPGVDPHGYEPVPADLAKVAQSTVLIINGAGLEEFLDGMLSNAGGQRLVMEASAGLEGRAGGEGEQGGSHAGETRSTRTSGSIRIMPLSTCATSATG